MELSPLEKETQKNDFGNLLIRAERLMEENLKKGKGPQAAITITCIVLGVNSNPLEDNAVLDHLWQKAYRELSPETFLQ